VRLTRILAVMRFIGVNSARWLALVASLSVAAAPCRADEGVAISQLPRPVLRALGQRFPSGRILEAEWDGDGQGHYEIKVQDGPTRHIVYVRAKGTIYKDEID
jgi:hypothetical protein